RLAVEAAQEKKAAGITVLDLTAAGAFTEYFVICTGFSTPQVQAICTEIEAQLHKNLGRSPCTPRVQAICTEIEAQLHNNLGRSPCTPQVQASCTDIEAQLHKNLGRSPEHREGHRSAEWALLDFGGFVVHVFSEQARRYYDLERLWRMAPKLEILDQPDGPSGERDLSDLAFRQEHFSGEAVSGRPQSGRSRQ